MVVAVGCLGSLDGDGLGVEISQWQPLSPFRWIHSARSFPRLFTIVDTAYDSI